MIAVPGHPGDHDRRHAGTDLAYRPQHEEPAEAVERAEDREEVGRLKPRSGVTDADGRDEQRKPAQAQRKEEL